MSQPNKAPSIPCRHCFGRGTVCLPTKLLRIYQKLQKAGKPLTSFDLEEEGVNPTTMNNRLVALESLELIQRAGKDGKTILWQLPPPSSPSV